jgi:transcriptional regulator with XRE-family HTH domain
LGVHLNSLARYERSERPPDPEFLQALGQKLQVNLNWLLLGEGEERRQDAKPVAYPFGRIDVEYLAGVIEAIESIVDSRGVKLSPAKKAEIVALAYEKLPRPGQEGGASGADTEAIDRLIRLAR